MEIDSLQNLWLEQLTPFQKGVILGHVFSDLNIKESAMRRRMLRYCARPEKIPHTIAVRISNAVSLYSDFNISIDQLTTKTL